MTFRAWLPKRLFSGVKLNFSLVEEVPVNDETVEKYAMVSLSCCLSPSNACHFRSIQHTNAVSNNHS